MDHLPDPPEKILKTNERRQLYKLICEIEDRFTPAQLLEACEKQQIKLGRTGILNFVWTLCHHGYLETYYQKVSNSRGRGRAHYKKTPSLFKLGDQPKTQD